MGFFPYLYSPIPPPLILADKYIPMQFEVKSISRYNFSNFLFKKTSKICDYKLKCTSWHISA